KTGAATVIAAANINTRFIEKSLTRWMWEMRIVARTQTGGAADSKVAWRRSRTGFGVFFRTMCLNRHGVHARWHQVGQKIIHQPMARNPPQALETGRNNAQPEV